MNCKIFQAPRNALRDWFVMQTLFNAHEVTHTSLCCHMLIAQLSLLNCPCPKRVHFLSRAWVLGQPCPEIMCFLVVVLMCGVSVWFVGCFLVNKKNNNNLTDSNARFQVSRRHLVKKKKKRKHCFILVICWCESYETKWQCWVFSQLLTTATLKRGWTTRARLNLHTEGDNWVGSEWKSRKQNSMISFHSLIVKEV